MSTCRIHYTLRSLFYLLLMGGLLQACGPKEDENARILVSVEGAYMPELAPGQTTGAVYMKLTNPSKENKVLNHVKADIAGATHVHRNIYSDGVMKMRMVNHLTLQPKTKLLFEPGGYHVMLMDISDPPELGSTFPIELHFEGGDVVSVNVKVKSVH